MMIELEQVKERLGALACDGWELTQTEKRGWEFYYIRHRLDQHRVVLTRTLEVKVYKASCEDGKEYLGSASGEIPPTASLPEVDALLSDLIFQAGLVRNPRYTLTDAPIELADHRQGIDVQRIAETFLRALKSVPETETEDINSYEIFSSALTRRTLNSNGVDYSCTYPSSEVEVVINARRDGHEIELYRIFDSGECDSTSLQSDIADALRFGRDRLLACPTPKLGKADVVFSTSDAAAIYDYFADRMSADMVVRGISDWQIGRPVVDNACGDRINLEALSSLKNSSADYPVDEEGSLIRDRWLIRDGVAENFWGSRQFSEYLGLKDSSIVHNFRFSGGKQSAEELRSGDFLETVEFSDFQVDAMSGDIAGEIRLAYWHHNGEITVVTGGSISGNMREAAVRMSFSKETRQYDNYVIPKVTRLPGLRITGVK